MSRELKFKIWDGKEMRNVEMLDLVSESANPYHTLDDEVVYYGSNEKGKLMQFTGLKDKNGKEIYENDIVKVISKRTFKLYGDTEKPLEVKWDGCCYSVRNIVGDASLYHYCNSKKNEVEIVGNIYEGLHSGEKT